MAWADPVKLIPTTLQFHHILVMIFNVGLVYADGPTEPTSQSVTGNKAITVAQRVWGTIKVIVQIAAIAAVVITGVRYMFASADGKADIKGQTIILIVGAVLVFAATTFATFVYDAAKQILQ